MRALAEFVMKDRRSAIIAVLLLGLVPMLNLLSPVIVGLTMLRKGWNDALAILARGGAKTNAVMGSKPAWCGARWSHGRSVFATRA